MSDYTPADNCCYLVREEWPNLPFDDVTHHSYLFVPSTKIFKRNSWEEAKKDAEFYYARRLKEIRVRKLMFPAVDNKRFTLTLSYAASETDIEKKEFVIDVTHDLNMPYDDDFKNGLFNKLKRNS